MKTYWHIVHQTDSGITRAAKYGQNPVYELQIWSPSGGVLNMRFDGPDDARAFLGAISKAWFESTEDR